MDNVQLWSQLLGNSAEPGDGGALAESSCGGKGAEFIADEPWLHAVSLSTYQRGGKSCVHVTWDSRMGISLYFFIIL